MVEKKKSVSVVNILLLQLIIIVYTTSGIMAKKASGYGFLSKNFIIFYAFEIIILAVYAILWQQIIKNFDLTIAYANRSISILWSLVWSVIFFHETITIRNMIGAIIIIIGIAVVNKNE